MFVVNRCIFILFLGFFAFLKSDQSCHIDCSSDFLPNRCGVWLRNETRLSSLGTYELGKGHIGLFCSFSSLPSPVQVQWMFRPSDSPPAAQWQEMACAKKEESKICGQDEIVVESSCQIRTTQLTQSGTYRCSATIPDHNNDHRHLRAVSSEFPISVIGVESPNVISSHLPLGRNGQIDIEICANPQPEIIWHTAQGLLQPKQSNDRFAVTSLTSRKVHSDVSGNGRLTRVPYCYTTSLLIHRVQEDDQFRLTVRGELNTLHEKISVRVKSASTLLLVSSTQLLLSISILYIYTIQ